MKLIDSHFHSLSIKEKGYSLKDAFDSISGGIDIGTEYNDLPDRMAVIADYPHILKSAAMGPWETLNTDKTELDRRFVILENNIGKYKADFLGEFGLDYYCGYGPEVVQEYLMIKHMELAKTKQMKVIIHNREANAETQEIIKRYPDVNGIIHCFSGNTEVLKTALNLGYYISYAGNVTYKSNNALRETLKYVPQDRLLLETDSPYLTPVPLRGKFNTPQYIIHTYKAVAEYLGKPIEMLADEVYRNFTCFCLHRF